MPTCVVQSFRLCQLLTAALLLPISASSDHDSITHNDFQRDNTPTCNISPAWDLTIQAYCDAGTDQNFTSFWSNHKSSGKRLDETFGNTLLNTPNLQCGVGATATCKIPDCQTLSSNGGQPWEYLAANSLRNLNNMFVSMHDGIYTNPISVQNILDQLSQKSYKWNESSTFQHEVAAWWPTLIAAVSTYQTSIAKETVSNTSISILANSSAAETSQGIQSASSIKSSQKGSKALQQVVDSYAKATQTAISNWSDAVFTGFSDSMNYNLFDYITNGTFVNPSSIPDNATISQFFQTMLVAKLTNMYWRQQPIYLLSTPLNQTILDPSMHPYAYISPTTGRLYIPYYYKGKQLQVPGSKLFASSTGFYNIHMSQIIESSVKTWEAAGQNYNDAMALSAITAITSPSANIWTKGPSFEGTFRLPICDIGSRIEWLVNYNQNNAPLPCCCGPYCAASKSFVATTGLINHYDWRTNCLKQLSATTLTVDYGIEAKSWFNSMSTGDKVWTVIVIFFGCCFGLYFVPIVGSIVWLLLVAFWNFLKRCGDKIVRRWTLYTGFFGQVKQKLNGGVKNNADVIAL